MKKALLTIALLAALLLPAAAQTGITPPPNLPAITNGSDVFKFALNMLPQADLSITNGPSSFQAGELEFEASAVFHTLNAVGVSPYASLGANYWFTKNLGLGGEIVTLNNGSGTSVADSGSAYMLARKPLGNIAGYVLAGFDRDFHLGENFARMGAGLEYRYNTGIGLMVDTSYLVGLKNQSDNGWLTRIGATLHF
jgi:opacity protein-like surface antigen